MLRFWNENLEYKSEDGELDSQGSLEKHRKS